MARIKVKRPDGHCYVYASTEGSSKVCCLIQDDVKCSYSTGIYTYSKRVQKIIIQKKLNIKVDSNAKHVCICDYHQAAILEAKNNSPPKNCINIESEEFENNENQKVNISESKHARVHDSPKATASGSKTNFRKRKQMHKEFEECKDNKNDIMPKRKRIRVQDYPKTAAIDIKTNCPKQIQVLKESREHQNNENEHNFNMPEGKYTRVQDYSKSTAVGTKTNCPKKKQVLKESRAHQNNENENNDNIPEVNLSQLPLSALKRYKRAFKVPSKPNLKKSDLANTLSTHLKSIPVAENEKEILSYFIYMVKTNTNELDENLNLEEKRFTDDE